MVCNRCKTIVKAELDLLEVQYSSVELGEVILKNKLTPNQRIGLYNALKRSGFELIDEKNNAIIEKLKKVISEIEHHSDQDLKTNFSDYISLNVKDNFISLNTLFSELEGITIEKYIIKHKIERVKELLLYNDYTLDEVAHKMHYSNVAELSRQFKKITGLSPLQFRQLRYSKAFFPEKN